MDTAERGGPQALPLIAQIEPQGLVIGVVGMKEGETRTITIPPEWGASRSPALAGKPLKATVTLVKVVK